MTSKIQNDSLEKISSEVRGCPLCKLSRTRKNAVAGEGLPSAKIMFIGEAPGKNEDEQGKPFVGNAGKILEKALTKAGIKRSEVFITNVVKCRPPNNRVPEPDERSACRPYLNRQISVVSPKVICILGSTAYASLLGGRSITSDRGKIKEKHGQRFFPTIHPGAAIYNKALRSVLERDLSTLKRELQKINDQSVNTLLDYTHTR